MMYPFMSLDDQTEITHSEMRADGTVKVYIEKPVYQGFHSVECYLPEYTWKNNEGFSDEEMKYYDEFVHSVAHIIIELSQTGGFDNASGF